MKFLGCLVLVAIVAAVTVVYSPRLLEIIEGENAESTSDEPGTLHGATSNEEFERQERARDQRRDVREFNDAARDLRDAQVEAMEAQIDRLEQAERDCYTAARQRGSTDQNCRAYADRIRAAEDQLREMRRR